MHEPVWNMGRYEMINLSLCLIKHQVMQAYWRVDVLTHAFLTSALDENELLASRFGHFTAREEGGPYTVVML
jgi:hypothetical protein